MKIFHTLCSIALHLIHQERALQTGRIVPRDLLAKTIEEVPRSVQELAPLVDYHVELMNDPANPDIEIVTPGQTWQTFTSNWIQYVLRSILFLLQTIEFNLQLQQRYFYYFVKDVSMGSQTPAPFTREIEKDRGKYRMHSTILTKGRLCWAKVFKRATICGTNAW